MKKEYLLATVFVFGLPGCGAKDPQGTPNGGEDNRDAAPLADAMLLPDSGGNCMPLATDYTPRDQGSSNDDWAACISDDNVYHQFDSNISSIARVAGFESIAQLLFTGSAPSAQDFTDARLIYLQDNGLDSRVSRREDEHYPPAPTSCGDMTPEEQQEYPDRCVGPVQILPLLTDAFAAGQQGLEPRLNAARVEAALLWFLYVSVYKEAITCTAKVNDCDSSYAYYTGGKPREGGQGLSRYVRERSPGVHDRIWDGILAVRCWRDLDNPTGEAMDTALRDQATKQLDRALLKGMAIIVQERIAALEGATGEDAQAIWAFLQILGPVLDREASERDAAMAEMLRTELAKSEPSAVDTSVLTAALTTIFPCP